MFNILVYTDFSYMALHKKILMHKYNFIQMQYLVKLKYKKLKDILPAKKKASRQFI